MSGGDYVRSPANVLGSILFGWLQHRTSGPRLAVSSELVSFQASFHVIRVLCFVKDYKCLYFQIPPLASGPLGRKLYAVYCM